MYLLMNRDLCVFGIVEFKTSPLFASGCRRLYEPLHQPDRRERYRGHSCNHRAQK
jgi:hypothetical protein